MSKISFGITFKLDIVTKLLLCSFVYTTTLTLERKLSYYGFRRRGFSNVTINELKNVIESEIQGPASMRGYRGLWHSLKISYVIIVERDIIMNILNIDPEGIKLTCEKPVTYTKERMHLKAQIPVGKLMATID